MRPLVPAVLAALLLLPLAAAVPLEARVDDARVIVELGEGLPASFYVAVTHVDERAWVDRLVLVEKNDAPNATLRLDGLPRNVPLTIRILPANTTLPRLAAAPDLLDAARLVQIPTIAEVTTRAIGGAAAQYVVPVPVARTEGIALRELRIAPTGDLMLIHMRTVTPGTSSTQGTFALEVAFSHDGGRTFNSTLRLTRPAVFEPQVRSAIDGDGKLVLIYGMSTWVDDPDDYQPGYYAYEPWRFLRIDPTTERILVNRTLRIDGYDIQWGGGELVAGPGAGTTLIWSGGLHELDDDGRATQVVPHGGVRVTTIDAAGRTDMEDDLPGAPCCGEIRAASSPGGAIAVIGTTGGSGPDDSMRGWVAVSRSGPDGFGNARNVTTGTVGSRGWQVYANAVSVDDAGNVNAVFGAAMTGSTTWRYEGYHFYVPRSGSVISQDLRALTPLPSLGATDDGVTGVLLASSGQTTWLSWSVGHQNRWLMRSVDGGRTWQTPMLLRSSEEPHQLEAYGQRPMDILPDGRPVIQGGSYGEGVAFPFEPELPAGSRLNRLYLAPAPPPPPPPREAVDVLNVTPRAITIPSGGEARITVTLRNVGVQSHTVSLSLSSGGTPLLFEPSTLHLEPGDTIVSGTVRLAREERAGATSARVQVKADNGNTSTSDSFEVRWEGVAPTTPPPPTPTRTPPLTTPPMTTPTHSPSPTPPPMIEPLPTTPSPVPGPGALLVVALVAALAILRRATVK